MCFSGKRNSERCRRETCYVIKIYFHYLSQAKVKSYLIYSQSKVKAELIYLQILLFAIEFCHSSPLQCMQNSKCIFVLCLQCRLFWLGVWHVWVAFEHLVFALFDRAYVIFYTSFELFYLASLTQLCIIRHWDLSWVIMILR